ncbi:hypothetical protein C923_02194 [Plasmodium falciparum UGT5.1]|uniref:Uncharacterized protein n=2 Tax=Plasmodium falciparum TaxID=5833 RepID=A0A024WTW4_PLAFA|nr:hypothetical protein PFMALIP_02100 [Plasmodium falciparum MaliPS096_E11]EWC77119.1 hypothetical protein C923_02194 [Plasmodium falciparum UGT5.1]
MKYKCMYKQKGINDTKYMNKKNMITKKTCFFKRLLQNLVTYKKKINKKKYKKKKKNKNSNHKIHFYRLFNP